MALLRSGERANSIVQNKSSVLHGGIPISLGVPFCFGGIYEKEKKKSQGNGKGLFQVLRLVCGTYGGRYDNAGVLRLKKDGRVKIDLKRMKKVKISGVPEEVLNAASQIPRNTTYFTPAKVHRHDYVCNRFRDTLATLQKKWRENKLAFSEITTPKETENRVRTESLMDGIYDYEEAAEKGTLAGMKRARPYYELEVALHANFIHQIASEMTALMLYEARVLGYNYPEVNRNKLETFIEETTNGKHKVPDLPHFTVYNNFYTVWNFLKHNSEELFTKVKERCPEMLLSGTYKNGQLSQYILKIDDEYIEKTLTDLGLFYDEFCEAFFGENPEMETWNYDDYFTEHIRMAIREENNPLNV